MLPLTEQLVELAPSLVLADPAHRPSLEGIASRIAAILGSTSGQPDTLQPALEELGRHARGLESDELSTRTHALSGASLALDRLLARLEPTRAADGEPMESAPAVESRTAPSAPRPEDAQLVLEFVTEAQEHLAGAEAGLLALESDPGNSDHLNSVFRSFHTIKGVAGFLDLSEIGALAHSAENLLDLARQKRLAFVGERVDVTLESLDVMRELVAGLSEAMVQGHVPQSHARLPALLARLKRAAIEGEPAPTSSPNPGFTILNAAPPQSSSRRVHADETSTSSHASAESVPAQLASTSHASPAPSPAPSPSTDTFAQQPITNTEHPGFTILNPSPAAARHKPADVAHDHASDAEHAPAHPASSAASGDTKRAGASGSGNSTGDGTVKVATSRLDSLINMVGELLTARLMVQQEAVGLANTRPKLVKNIAHLAKISRELQDLSMSMRMVPIQGVFQKMGRIVRDVARKAGKEVDFDFVGGETELDRNLVEAISDPLVHMIRNAADHGVERPEDRVAAGKPRAGRIQLRAFHQAGNVVIQIVDDGRGLNRARILEKAVAAGLVQNPSELVDSQVWALIFHAGLSTADKVTDISGRGVGMDVVKRNVEALRGRIDIESTPGKGSVFTIRLPLTLAMIDAMVVKVGSSRYILPMSSIERSIRPRQEQLSTVRGKGEMCLVRGSLLPLFRLHRLFGIRPTHEDPTEALGIIVQAGDRRCCVIVDELLGIQQVIIKSLSEDIAPIQGICGGAILGDGCVSLIVDVPGLIDLATFAPETTDLIPQVNHS